ncbi:hypothetical protein ABT354_00935 [Streptomyces sp. NPDC000594]|uniref:hypothetical protein n=1 Tax=Streptomyces sp. NPDC000594 TaxID=3154261 RepID=UPI00331677BA
MSTRTGRPWLLGRVVAAFALAVALTAQTGTAATAAPQPIGRCTTSSGVVLAVDLSRWGGPIMRSCGTTPTTGYELLNQGGWRTTGTGHDGPAFICRIGYSGFRNGKQYPTPRDEDCVLTPPATAYWSYWHAGPGEDTWEYSRLGAMSYRPQPGSVDLWIFGATDVEGVRGRPTVTPDQLRAHNTRPSGGGSTDRPRPRPTTAAPAPTTGRPAPPARSATPSQDGSRPAPRASGPAPRASAADSATPSPSRTATATAAPAATAAPEDAAVAAPGGAARVADAPPAADTDNDTGSALPALITAALVALIGGGAVYTARRRRRAG